MRGATFKFRRSIVIPKHRVAARLMNLGKTKTKTHPRAGFNLEWAAAGHSLLQASRAQHRRRRAHRETRGERKQTVAPTRAERGERGGRVRRPRTLRRRREVGSARRAAPLLRTSGAFELRQRQAACWLVPTRQRIIVDARREVRPSSARRAELVVIHAPGWCPRANASSRMRRCAPTISPAREMQDRK